MKQNKDNNRQLEGTLSLQTKYKLHVHVAMRLYNNPCMHMCPVWYNVHTTRITLCSVFTILKPYFHQKISLFQIHLDRRVFYDCEASSHQVNNELASQNHNVISVSIHCLVHGFQSDIQRLLLAATTVEISMPVVKGPVTRVPQAYVWGTDDI